MLFHLHKSSKSFQTNIFVHYKCQKYFVLTIKSVSSVFDYSTLSIHRLHKKLTFKMGAYKYLLTELMPI